MNIKKYFSNKSKSKKGFTLIEMIVTVAVLAIVSTATVQILFAVQDISRNTGTTTAEQYATGQVEKFIRNEFQVASNLGIYTGTPTSVNKNDEYVCFNATDKTVEFKKVLSDGGNYETYLTIDSVKRVTIDIKPLDTTNPDSPFKLVYTIDAENYTYSGGIVIGNTRSGDKIAGPTASYDQKTITWGFEDDGTTPCGDNNACITFHSETKSVTSSTSST